MKRILVAVVFLISALLILDACSTIKVRVGVERAPELYLAKMGNISADISVRDGKTEILMHKICVKEYRPGEKKVVQSEALGEKERNDYALAMKQILISVINEKKDIKLVDSPAKADHALLINADITEQTEFDMGRCANLPERPTVKCLPDPPDQCGCVAAEEGKLNVNDYDWNLEHNESIQGDFEAQILEKSDIKKTANITAYGYNIAEGGRTLVEGQPDVPKEIIDVGFDGSKFKRAIPYKEWMQFARPEFYKSVKSKFEQLIAPYVENMDLTIYKLKISDELKNSVELLKKGRFADAIAIFKKNAESIDKNSEIKAKDKSHFYYDYAVALMQIEDFEEAKKCLDKAKSYYSEKIYQDLFDEINRRIKDKGELEK